MDEEQVNQLMAAISQLSAEVSAMKTFIAEQKKKDVPNDPVDHFNEWLEGR